MPPVADAPSLDPMARNTELGAARLRYRTAVARAVESLRRQEREFEELCAHLEAARRDLHAAGYLHGPRRPPREPSKPRPRRWNEAIERAQLRIARELGRRPGGPSAGVPTGHPGHTALPPRSR